MSKVTFRRNSKQSEWVPTHGFLTDQNAVLTKKTFLGTNPKPRQNYGGNYGKQETEYTNKIQSDRGRKEAHRAENGADTDTADGRL